MAAAPRRYHLHDFSHILSRRQGQGRDSAPLRGAELLRSRGGEAEPRRRRAWQGARLLVVCSVEAIDRLQVMDACACGVLLGRAVVACPFRQVLELPPAAEQAGVQDLVHITKDQAGAMLSQSLYHNHHERKRRLLRDGAPKSSLFFGCENHLPAIKLCSSLSRAVSPTVRFRVVLCCTSQLEFSIPSYSRGAT